MTRKYAKVFMFFAAIVLLTALLCGGFFFDKNNQAAASSTVIEINSPSDVKFLTPNISASTRVVLNCDIDASITPLPNITSFAGVFEGNGHVIYKQSKPLFQVVSLGAKVKDLNLRAFNYSVNDNTYVSAIVTNNFGTLTNISVEGNFSGKSIGGIAGVNNGSIVDSDVIGNIIGKGANSVGGITAINYGNIENSNFFGTVKETSVMQLSAIGGIAAKNEGNIIGCATFAEVTLGGQLNFNFGGVVGENGAAKISGDSASFVKGVIRESFFAGEFNGGTSASLYGGGIAGRNISSHIEGSYSVVETNGVAYGVAGANGTTILFSGQPSYFDEEYEVSYNFSTLDLQSSADNSAYPLSESNQKISVEQAYHLSEEEENLASLLSYNGTGNWRGSAEGLAFIEDVVIRGAGSALQPFSISTVEDFLKIEYISQHSLNYYKQVQDIDFLKFNYNTQKLFKGSYQADGFALLNLETPYLFQDNQGFIYGLGLINCNVTGVSQMGNGAQYYVDSTDFGHSGDFNAVLTVQPELGEGTEQNPFVIQTKQELAYISNSAGYFILGNSISVNNFSDSGWQLSLMNFSGVLDGKGYQIVGLLEEALVDLSSLQGAISNVTVRGYSKTAESALVASSVGEYGLIENVTVYGRLEGNYSGAIAFTNNGKIRSSTTYANLTGEGSAAFAQNNGESGIIEYCENYGNVFIAFGNNTSENAVMHSCASYGETVLAYNGEGTLDSSIRAGNLVELWHGGVITYESEAVPASKLMTVEGFSLSLWKYPVYQEEIIPYLSRQGKHYKADGAAVFNSSQTSLSRVYTPSGLNKQNTQLARLSSHSYQYEVEFIWYYSHTEVPESIESNLLGDNLVADVGYYVLSCTYHGSETMLSYTFNFIVTINKGALPAPVWTGEMEVESEDGGIEMVPYVIKGLSGQPNYVYRGESRYLWDIAPFNYKFELNILEEEYSYTVRKDGNILTYTEKNMEETARLNFDSKLKDAGTYSVTLTVNNKNYQEKSVTVNYSVTPAEIAIDISDAAIDYLDAPPTYEYLVTLSREEGIGDGEYSVLSSRALAAVQAFSPYSEYSTGSGAGSYAITLAFANPNYTSVISTGTLTVNKLALSEELLQTWGVSFEDKSLPYNGLVQPLNAELGSSGVNVTYTGNGNKNAGVYNVQATFEKASYISLTVQRTLEITAVDLNISPKSLSIYYLGEPLFSLADADFLGEDTYASLNGNAEFNCEYIAGDDCGEYEITVSGLTSENYTLHFQGATLTVNTAYMSDLFAPYQNKTATYSGLPIEHNFHTGSYQTEVVYEYFLNTEKLETAPINTGKYRVFAVVKAINGNYRDTTFDSEITVNKAFAGSSVSYSEYYSYVYGQSPSYVEYSGTLPEKAKWAIVYTIKKGLDTVPEFTDVGVYTQIVSFYGNVNYEEFSLQTTVEISPRSINISVSEEVYRNGAIVPIVTVLEEIGDALSFTFLYSLVDFESKFENAVRAGEYVCYATVANSGNYVVANKPILKINKFEVSFTPKFIEYTYGEFSDEYYFDYVRYSIDKQNIVQWQYLVETTNELVDRVSYTVGGWEYGIWNVVSVAETTNYKFVIPPGAHIGKISVQKRTLTVKWNAESVTAEYAGAPQDPFTVTVGNTFGNDSISYVFKSNGNMRTVGVHDVWVELGSADERKNINYSMPQGMVKLEIVPAPLTVKAGNIKVQKGGEPQFSASITGLKGSDTLSSLNIILSYQCAYSENAAVGAKFPIDVVPFNLEQYAVTFVRGELSVVERSYALLTLPSKSFVYDGEPKGLTFGETIPQGAQINFYGTNYKTNAGIYNVRALIIFPDGTTQEISSTMSIAKAVPKVTVQPIILPYSVVANLQNNDIIGTSTLNNIKVMGAFSFTGNRGMRLGENTYTVKFVPEDTKNLEEVSFTVNVTCKTVKEEVLEFDSDTIIISEGKIEKSGEVKVSLTSIYTDMVLKVNGVEVESYTLTNETDVDIEVFRHGNKLFGRNYTIVEIELVPLEPKPNDVVWDEHIFVLTEGAYFKDGKILLRESAKLSLDSELEGVFFFINGKAAGATAIVITPDSGTLRLQVKYGDEVVYDKSFTVMLEEDNTNSNQNERVMDEYLWAKVLGGVLVGGVLVVCIFFLIRKIKATGRKEFNPYEKIKKKK